MIDLCAAVNAGTKIAKKTTPGLSFKISTIADEVMSYGIDLRSSVSELEWKSKKMRRAAVAAALLVPPELIAYSYIKSTNSTWENLILFLFVCTGLTGGYFISQYRLYDKLTTYLRTGQDGDVYKTEFV